MPFVFYGLLFAVWMCVLKQTNRNKIDSTRKKRNRSTQRFEPLPNICWALFIIYVSSAHIDALVHVHFVGTMDWHCLITKPSARFLALPLFLFDINGVKNMQQFAFFSLARHTHTHTHSSSVKREALRNKMLYLFFILCCSCDASSQCVAIFSYTFG